MQDRQRRNHRREDETAIGIVHAGLADEIEGEAEEAQDDGAAGEFAKAEEDRDEAGGGAGCLDHVCEC